MQGRQWVSKPGGAKNFLLSKKIKAYAVKPPEPGGACPPCSPSNGGPVNVPTYMHRIANCIYRLNRDIHKQKLPILTLGSVRHYFKVP